MRRLILIAVLLIVGVASVLWVASAFVADIVPEGVRGLLFWLGIVVPAAVALLAGFKNVMELVERFVGGAERGEQTPATVNVGVQNQTVRLLVQQYNLTAPQERDEEQLAREVKRYLQWLVDFTGSVKLTGIRRQGGEVVQLALDKVYVPLQAIRAEEGGERGRGLAEEGASRAIEMKELLDLGSRIVVTGAPGSGKTTVLMYLALMLGRAMAADDEEIAAEKVGWTGALPLPLFIPLSRFAAYWRDLDRSGVPQADRRRTLAAYISQYLIERQATFSLPDDFFVQLVAAGQPVLLLLDGLDEVPDEDTRARVRQAIEDLVTGKEQLTVVVTCRTAAYRGRSALGRDFQPVQVLPLQPEHVRDLVSNTYALLEAHDETRRAGRTDSLLHGIGTLEETRRARLGPGAERLVTTPLMVRLLLIVHFGGGELPEQRAELYGRAIDSLLYPDYALDENVAESLARQVGDRHYYRALLKHLAFHMHKLGEEQGLEIDEDHLRETLQKEPELADLTESLIRDARTRGTVLEERFGAYRFVHLALQEYLAAAYLADDVRETDKIVQFLEGGLLLESWWREVVLLLCGYLHVGSGPIVATRFLRRLAGVGTQASKETLSPATRLAAVELAATAVLDLPQSDERLKQALAQRLLQQLRDEAVLLQSPANVRVWAGAALGQLGEGEERLLEVDQMELCFVPAGAFWMGDDAAELEVDGIQPALHENEVVYDYWLGRMPVTNAQFAAFVLDGGYEEEAFWGEAKDAGRWQFGFFTGWYFNVLNTQEMKNGAHDYGTPFNLPGHPVVGVSWYEALAFCRWLTRRWQGIGVLPGDWRVILPSEAEWEKGARGGLQIPLAPRIVRAAQGLNAGTVDLQKNREPERIYPWGNAFEADRANTAQSALGASNRAGSYPRGASVYGCLEMSGNVWEWTRSIFGVWDFAKQAFGETHTYPYIADERERLDDGPKHMRVLRGGNWLDGKEWARCGARLGDFPYNGEHKRGFRVALSQFTSDL